MKRTGRSQYGSLGHVKMIEVALVIGVGLFLFVIGTNLLVIYKAHRHTVKVLGPPYKEISCQTD